MTFAGYLLYPNRLSSPKIARSMHEMALTQDLIELVAERCSGKRVVRVMLEVGKLAAVVPDAFRFCFELCAQGTLAEGAELVISETRAQGRCRGCAAALELDGFFGQCACGSHDLEILSGDELKLTALEVVDV